MTYVIVLIIILVIIALVILLCAPGRRSRPKGDRPGAEAAVPGVEPPRAAGEEVSARSVPHAEPSTAGKEKHPAPGLAETADEEELELSFETTDNRPGAGAEGSAASAAGISIDEEELDLSLEDIDEMPIADDGFVPVGMAGSVAGGRPAGSAADVEEVGGEEEIPFILEEQEGGRGKAGGEIAPALEGVAGESVGVAEETPESLAERLDLFFGGGEDAGPEAQEPDRTGEEPPDEYPAAAVGLTLEGYEAELRILENKLRGTLNAALESGKTAGLGLLERKLTAVCGRLSDIRDSFRQRQQLVADLEEALGAAAAFLPGFPADDVRRHLQAGNVEAARLLLDNAAAQLEDTARQGARISYLGGCLAEEQTDYGAALALYGRACAADEAHPGYLYAAGRMARILGREEEAGMLLDRLLENAGQPQDVAVRALGQHELARLYAGANEKDKAENLLLSAITAMEGHGGGNGTELGAMLHDLAVLYESSGRYDEAEPLYRRALDVIENRMGGSCPDLAAIQYRLAGLYEEMELEEKAPPLYEKALEIKMEVLGWAHPDVGTILNHLANLRRQQGRFAEAEPMFLRSLAILEKALGPGHPNLAVVLNNLAELYSDMGDGEKAEQFQERAFALFQLPGDGEDFVEMEKEHILDPDEEKIQTIAGG